MQDCADHIISLIDIEKDKQSIMFHRFPIKTICEIDVIISLEFLNEGKTLVRFLVDSFLLVKDDDTLLFCKVIDKLENGFANITREKVMDYLKEIIEIIPTLKLDKFTGTLTDEFVFETEQWIQLFKFDNTILKYDICCVCHELCGTTTECHHHICVACVSKLSENNHECSGICDECGIKTCPCCRKNFSYIIKT